MNKLKLIALKYSKQDADDIVQKTHMKLLKHEGPIENEDAFFSTVANNVARNHLRDKKTREKTISLTSEGIIGEGIVRSYQFEDPFEYEDLYNAIEELSEKQKEVVMYLLNGYTYLDISNELGYNKNTVKATGRQALAKLKSLLEG